MQDTADSRRKIIIATGNEALAESLTALISKYVKNSIFAIAKDGNDAEFKVSNSVPHVMVIDSNLAKRSGAKLVEFILQEYKDKKVGFILFPDVPDRSVFVDEVVSGCVQFLDEPENETKLAACLNRAIGYAFNHPQVEMKAKSIKPGDVLIKEGEKGDAVYILRSGELTAYVIRDNKEVPLGKIEPGEFVGEMAYIQGEPRSASVKANTACELIEIPMSQMDQVLFNKPAWSKALMKTLSHRVKNSNLLKV